MRLIEKSEIKKVCRKFAEIFKDYEAYDIFFERDSGEKRITADTDGCLESVTVCDNFRQQKKIYYFYRFEIYAAQNYTYVFDDYRGIASVKRPGDKDADVALQMLNPAFAIAFFAVTGIKACVLASEYMNFARAFAEKYYNPATDCYIKNIGVAKEVRGQGLLKRMINELCADMPVYLETHDANNVKIYEHLGFELLEAVEWRGITHYAMKRRAVEDVR